MERLLVLMRHGESEWNAQNLFAGWRDIALTEQGREEARRAGRLFKTRHVQFDVGFASALQRARHTLELVLAEMGQTNLPVLADQALNERDYGALTGLNRDDARRRWGEEQVRLWRRSYTVRPPDGESLKDTGARLWPYYLKEILPRVMRGERVLVSSHGTTLRALMMVLEGLSGDEIVKQELETGAPIFYRLNPDTTVASKEMTET